MRVQETRQFKNSYSVIATRDRVSVLSMIAKLEKAPTPIGKTLRLPLEKCRSLRTGHRGQLRVVYLLESDHVLLLVVGNRTNLEVYSDAANVLRELGL
jgi:mRNA-degrading endonuclease RelE of RelBE toxin-antitoxin system